MTLRPTRDLTSGALEPLTVKGAPDGPTDDAGLSLVDPFVSTFTVRDSMPPVVASASPASGALQVPPDAVVRVAFSEPVIGATIAVRDGANVPVTGAVTLAVGGTVAIFTPVDFLRANASYTVTVSNVADPAGNRAAPVDRSRPRSPQSTRWRRPSPRCRSSARRESGPSVTMHPTIADTDVQRVEYSLGSIPRASHPGAVRRLAHTAGRCAVDGRDRRGLRPGRQSIRAVQPADRHSAEPAADSDADEREQRNDGSQGQTLNFDVRADDDDELAQIFFTAVGSVQRASCGRATGQTT